MPQCLPPAPDDPLAHIVDPAMRAYAARLAEIEADYQANLRAAQRAHMTQCKKVAKWYKHQPVSGPGNVAGLLAEHVAKRDEELRFTEGRLAVAKAQARARRDVALREAARQLRQAQAQAQAQAPKGGAP